mgnify:CR=1 FL=1
MNLTVNLLNGLYASRTQGINSKKYSPLNFTAAQDKVEIKNEPVKEYHLSNGIYKTAGYVKFKDKFSQDEIKTINETRKLPEGYYLISNRGYNIINTSTGKNVRFEPPYLAMVKLSEKELLRAKKDQIPLIKNIPECFSVTTDKKGDTYLLDHQFANVEEAKSNFKKERRKQSLIAITYLAALTVGICALYSWCTGRD